MRYWKGAYDEDTERDLELRQARGLPAEDEKRDMWFFRFLMVLQILLFSLAGLLYVSSR